MIVSIASLKAAGLTDAQIVAVTDAAEREREAKVREQTRIRVRNHRARNAVTRDTVTADGTDVTQDAVTGNACNAVTRDSVTEQKKGFPDLPKENTPPPSEPLKEVPQSSSCAFNRICEILRGLGPQPDDAKLLHDIAEAALRAENFDVIREFSINLGDEHGLIDLVVRRDGEPSIAIELDRRLPRAKSLRKLAAFDGFRIAVTRTHAPNPEFERLVDAVIAVPPQPREARVVTLAPRGTRLPPDWQPSPADLAFAGSLGMRLYEIDSEAAKFADYWHAKAGPNGVKLDWPATWRNWCRKALEGRPRSNGNGQHRSDVVDAGERLIAAEKARTGDCTGPLLDLTPASSTTSDAAPRPLPKR